MYSENPPEVFIAPPPQLPIIELNFKAKYLCLNGHASDLPRWRGAAPIHRAIEAGDKITAVQAMIMEETLDTGAIVSSKEVLISESDNFKSLHDKLSQFMPKVLLNAIDSISKNNFSAIQQNNTGISYKMIQSMSRAKLIGPLLIGLGEAIEIAPLRSSTSDILNLASVAAYSAGIIDYKKN